jgi:hypothetical protein
MLKLLLFLLEKIVPYRTKFGFSLAEKLKYWYYYKIGQYKTPKKCLCGGKIRTYGAIYPEGYTVECNGCYLLIDED